MGPDVEEVPDFLKIPKPLQQKFFAVAEEEYRRILSRIEAMDDVLKWFRQELARGIRAVVKNDSWRSMKIAFVDGSDTPAIDDRIGVRYGLYAVAFKVFKGIDSVENGEAYIGDRLVGEPGEPKEKFLKKLDLITTYYERVTALNLLRTDNYELKPDLVIIDGSFFGYRTGCSAVKRDELEWEDPLTKKRFHYFYELIVEISRLTEEILKTGRAIGVIKRVPTAAIDGYLRYKHGSDAGINLSDRALLSLFLKTGEVFDYQQYLEPHLWYDTFSWYSSTARDRKMRGKDAEAILKEAERRIKIQIKSDLNPPNKKEDEHIIRLVRGTRRFFIRTTEEQPPVCVEIPEDFDDNLLQPLISYLVDTANPATGLPLGLDLVDDLVSLPRGIGKEFIDEIEARLLMHGIPRHKLMALFSRFNPQKEIE